MNTIKNAPLALVTGTSRGIGKAIAEALAEAGYHLILTCSHTLPDLQEVAACLEEKYGITCTAMAADASEPAAIEKFLPPWTIWMYWSTTPESLTLVCSRI